MKAIGVVYEKNAESYSPEDEILSCPKGLPLSVIEAVEVLVYTVIAYSHFHGFIRIGNSYFHGFIVIAYSHFRWFTVIAYTTGLQL